MASIREIRFCIDCKEPVESDGHRCARCGRPLIMQHESGIFLTEHSGHDRTTIHLEAGTVLGDRFKIDHFIAKGRHGSVYRAEDNLRSMPVALKVIDIGPSGSGTSILHSQREAVVYNRITDFSHIIRLYDTHTLQWGASGLLLLSMELADSETFRKWLSDHRDNLDERSGMGLAYFKQICQGVFSLHSSDIIHLDLKPENIFFSHGRLKLSDLGAAIPLDRYQNPKAASFEYDPPISGTPSYMAPECFDPGNQRIDQRADIYSLGAMLYEILDPKGYPPFAGTFKQPQDLHAKGVVPDLPETNKTLGHVLQRCLARNPSDRYENVEALMIDLYETANADPPENGYVADCETAAPHQIDKMWERASYSFSEGDLRDAFTWVESLLSKEPEHAQGLKLREIIATRFQNADRLYQEIARKLESDDLDDLVNLVEEARLIYPEHPSGVSVQLTLYHRSRMFRISMEAGIQALAQHQWEIALNHLQKALAVNAGAIQLMPMIRQLLVIEDARKKVDLALMNGSFDEARRLASFVDAKAEVVVSQLRTD